MDPAIYWLLTRKYEFPTELLEKIEDYIPHSPLATHRLFRPTSDVYHPFLNCRTEEWWYDGILWCKIVYQRAWIRKYFYRPKESWYVRGYKNMQRYTQQTVCYKTEFIEVNHKHVEDLSRAELTPLLAEATPVISLLPHPALARPC